MRALFLRSVPVSETKLYMASFAEVLLVFSVFTKEIASSRIFGIDFDFVAYTFAIGYFIYNFRSLIATAAVPWKLFLYFILSSLFSIIFLNLGYGGFLKQIIPIIIIYAVNFHVIWKYDWHYVFRLYVKFAFFSAVFGIIQVLLSFQGIDVLIKIPGRLDSISYEPSHYASILLPALIFTFFHYKEYKTYFLTMLLALILTFNLTGYLTFLLVLSIAYVNIIYLIVSVPLLYYLVFHVFVNFNENFNTRIVETQEVFSGNLTVLSRDVDANGTTTSLYSNLVVAQDNLKHWNIIGSGVGGHEEMYHRFYKNSPFVYNWYYGLNAPSAHSLTIRVFSELGIAGLIFYVVSIAKRVILLDKGKFRSISLACLSHFISKSFKLGGIIDYGTPFFVAMLCLNFWQFKYKNPSP